MSELVGPLAFNVFPATVISPDGALAHAKVRAVASKEWFVVYGDQLLPGGGRLAVTVRKARVASVRPHETASGAWVVIDYDGVLWTVARGQGCGCASALQHMPSPLPVDL